MTDLIKTTGKLLTGRLGDPETGPLTTRHLVAGLVFAWLAGIGRYWDHPRATLLMHSGLGSVAYVFALAAFIWLLGLPLRIKRWSYRDLLAYISLTSPLAFLYAVPVERWLAIGTARTINMWFLLIVAVWRVFLYSRYLSRRVVLTTGGWFMMIALPLSLIVNLLTILNLEHVIVNLMAGVDDGGSGSGAAYAMVNFLALVSWLVWPPTFLWYVERAIKVWRDRGARTRAGGDS